MLSYIYMLKILSYGKKVPFHDHKMHFRYERARRALCRYWNGIIRSIPLCSTTFPPALKSQSSLTFIALSLRSKTCKEVWSLVGNLAYLESGECCIWVSGLKKKRQTLMNSYLFNFRFLSSGDLKRKWHHSFIRYEMLRKEYLNQTFNFMPDLQELYDKRSRGQNYEEAQRQITQKEDYSQLGIYHLLKRFRLFKEKRDLNRKLII